jgi:hypothetical protein
MATTTLASSAADRPAGEGGVQLWRRGWRADALALSVVLLLSLLALIGAYARQAQVGVGVVGIEDFRRLHYRTHLSGFHEPEAVAGQDRVSYRWTQERATIAMPGLGRGLWQTELELGSPIPEGQPKQALISAGDVAWLLQLQPQQRTYHLLTPSSGDVRVTIEADAAPSGSDPRPLGVTFGGVAFEAASVAALPPTLFLLHTLLALVIGFLTLRLIGVPTWLALSATAIAIALLALGTATNRAPMGLYSIRLLAMSVVGLVLMALLRWTLPRLFRLGGIEAGRAAWAGLLVVIYISFLVRAGGLLWPYFLSVDIEWHMEKTQRVLNGRIGELWNANSPFHQSVMPEDEWGANRPVIPYSPFYHIFSALWAIFPWQLKLSAEVFSAALDALRAPIIFFIVRKLGLGDRSALIGALTYEIIPASFLLHAWGNTPTTNGMWWSLLTTTLLVGGWNRLRSPSVWGAITIALTLTLLFYAVTAVFTGLLVALLVLALLVTGQRQRAWPLLGSLIAASVLSLGIYYWQFVPLIIERTLPRFGEAAADTGRTIGGQEISLAQYFSSYFYLLDIYGMYLPLIAALAGYVIGVRKWGATSLFSLLMSVWGVIAIVFWLVGIKLSMVDKQVFWLMPWMGIGAAVLADRVLSQRSLVRWAAPLLLIGALYTGADALLLWTHRVSGYGIGEGYTSLYQAACRSLYDRATCVPEW